MDLIMDIPVLQSVKNIELQFKSVLESAFPAWVKRCEKQFPILLQTIPKDWYVEVETVENKLSQLFEEQWIKSVWDNFVECLNENISHE